MAAIDVQTGLCVVLGGRGFIGSHVVENLLARGIPVRVFGRPRAVGAHSYVDDLDHSLLQVIEGDYNSEADLRRVLDGCSHCINLITTTLPSSSNADMVFDVQSNLVGIVTLLKVAQSVGVRKVVFVSSGGTVYGAPKYIPIDEDHPTDPQSSYGITKLASEKYLSLYTHLYGLKTTVLRVANPFGERQRPGINQGAIAVFAARALVNEPIYIWGDGSVIRDYLYITDCAEAIHRATYQEHAELVFNVGSGVGRDLRSIIRAIGVTLGKEIDVRYEPARALDVSRSVLDIGRAERVLGWRPTVTFEEGLEKTVHWLRLELASGRLRREVRH